MACENLVKGDGRIRSRLGAIDELRAIAIIFMMLAHFGPGVIERLPTIAPYGDAILFWSRFATVMFILVFGITVGFVHYTRMQSNGRSQVISRLNSRTRLVFLCALIIHIPNVIGLWESGSFGVADVLFAMYSVLTFYTFAFLSVRIWLYALGKHPMVYAPLIGLGHWIVASMILAIWPQSPAMDTTEFLRFVLVSGPFAYLQLAGAVLFAIPVGIYLEEQLRSRSDSFGLKLIGLVILGLALTAIGWGWGRCDLPLQSFLQLKLESRRMLCRSARS